MRLWLAMPDWSFRVIGLILVCAYLNVARTKYANFPKIGPFLEPIISHDASGRPIFGPPVYFPWSTILADLTFVQIGLAFCFRTSPRRRADRAREIIIPLIVAVWPLLPFLVVDVLGYLSPASARALAAAVLPGGRISYLRFYSGVCLLSAGLALEVWGYATLFRSLAIVAEARELKVSGPYRLARHPIYFGQFLAQAGYWLVLLRLQLVWVVFYALFVTMQLYRSRLEDGVLERAFGERYVAWKRKTFWFV